MFVFLYLVSSLQYCAKKQAKLEEERTVNAELIRSVADLTRSRTEVLRELEALKAKLRSLEVSIQNKSTVNVYLIYVKQYFLAISLMLPLSVFTMTPTFWHTRPSVLEL